MKSKKLKSLEGKDRLSELPDQILVHILSFLPTKDAVRTMLLRRFENLWTLVPSLEFEFTGSNYDDDDELFTKYPLFVRNVLMLHKRLTIDRFRVRLGMYDENVKVGNHVKMWLKFALGREVKELDLYADCDDNLIDEPILPVFRSQSLVRLELSGCRIERQCRVHLQSLKKLLLNVVYICDEAFTDLNSGCSSLQELVVNYAYGLKKLCFSAPNFQKLCLSGYNDGIRFLLDCPNLKILDLQVRRSLVPEAIDVSSLRELNISGFYINDTSDKFAKIFMEKIKDIEVFRLSCYTRKLFEFISDVELPENRWRRVDLDGDFDIYPLSGICNMMKSSTHVEELTLQVTGCYGLNNNLPSSELSTSCVMPHLKTITMHGYNKPFESQLQLLEFLLGSAVILEKLIIIPKKNQLEADEELEFVKQLASFPRAAANARIVFV